MQTAKTMIDFQDTVQIDPSEASTPIHNHPYVRFFEGFGGPFPDKISSGNMDPKFQSLCIKILEAMAMFLTLKRLNLKKGSHIRLMPDNTIVHCLNRFGSRSSHIDHVILAILALRR